MHEKEAVHMEVMETLRWNLDVHRGTTGHLLRGELSNIPPAS